MENTNTLRVALISVLALAVTSCSLTPTPLQIPTTTQTLPTATFAPVSPPEIAIPTVISTGTVSECPINSEQVTFIQDRMLIKPSEHDGWCEVSLPLNGYTTIGYNLRYPTGWVVTLAGAEGMNLRFDTQTHSGKDQEVFIQLTTTDLPLEQADKATYSFEVTGSDPLVGVDEHPISRTMQNIGDKQVLALITSRNDLSIKRYFTLHGSTLYMFEIEIPSKNFGDNESAGLLAQVEELVSSLQFVR